MGVEVSQDESITLGVEEEIKGRSVVGGAGGSRGDVYVINVQGCVVYGDGDCEVFDDGVVWEEVIGRECGVRDGVVNEDE